LLLVSLSDICIVRVETNTVGQGECPGFWSTWAPVMSHHAPTNYLLTSIALRGSLRRIQRISWMVDTRSGRAQLELSSIHDVEKIGCIWQFDPRVFLLNSDHALLSQEFCIAATRHQEVYINCSLDSSEVGQVFGRRKSWCLWFTWSRLFIGQPLARVLIQSPFAQLKLAWLIHRHMSPEVLLEGRVSKAADVYAFGITMWELFTAGYAYKGVKSIQASLCCPVNNVHLHTHACGCTCMHNCAHTYGLCTHLQALK